MSRHACRISFLFFYTEQKESKRVASWSSRRRICRWGTSSSAGASAVCRRCGSSACTPSRPPPRRPCTPPENSNLMSPRHAPFPLFILAELISETLEGRTWSVYLAYAAFSVAVLVRLRRSRGRVHAPGQALGQRVLRKARVHGADPVAQRKQFLRNRVSHEQIQEPAKIKNNAGQPARGFSTS